jgi:hypothetical protein
MAAKQDGVAGLGFQLQVGGHNEMCEVSYVDSGEIRTTDASGYRTEKLLSIFLYRMVYTSHIYALYIPGIY